MKRRAILAAGLCLLAAGASIRAACGGEGTIRNRVAARRSTCMPWNGHYVDPAWGTPLALVVPPTARNQTHYGWGVGETRVGPIYHQYGTPFTGAESYNPSLYLPVPPRPSDTDQFGVYYARGPW
ncbi:MAG: hypothetical protein ABSF26_18745 [Thermoguttaceae bacterium]|jgi:hypothetical protein